MLGLLRFGRLDAIALLILLLLLLSEEKWEGRLLTMSGTENGNKLCSTHLSPTAMS